MQTSTTDAPLLPIAQLIQLKQIAPERLAWVFEETTKEAEFRRRELRRINTLVFCKHLSSLGAGLLAVAGGIGASLYCASIHESLTAATFATTTIGVLAWAFLGNRKAEGATDNTRSE